MDQTFNGERVVGEQKGGSRLAIQHLCALVVTILKVSTKRQLSHTTGVKAALKEHVYRFPSSFRVFARADMSEGSCGLRVST